MTLDSRPKFAIHRKSVIPGVDPSNCDAMMVLPGDEVAKCRPKETSTLFYDSVLTLNLIVNIRKSTPV